MNNLDPCTLSMRNGHPPLELRNKKAVSTLTPPVLCCAGGPDPIRKWDRTH